MKKTLENKLRQIFHLKHEIYTRLAYQIPYLPPHRYSFILTNQCNLKCSFCSQHKEFMPEDTLKKEKWIELSETIPAFTRITLTGGEPLLAKGFKEIFINVAKRHPCNLITNGLLLNQDIIDTIISYPKCKVLAVSLDGLRDDSMKLRGISQKQWDNLASSIKYFIQQRNQKRSNCVLEIKTLVLNENSDKLMDIHRYCMRDLGADHHTFQFLKGSPMQHSDRAYRREEIFKKSAAPRYNNFNLIMEELDKIRDYNIANNTAAFLHPITANLNTKYPLRDISFLNNEAFEKDLFKPCRFPWSSIHINYNGDLFPCLSIPIGNVREKPIKTILKGKDYRSFLRIIRKEGLVEACNRCGWLRPWKDTTPKAKQGRSLRAAFGAKEGNLKI